MIRLHRLHRPWLQNESEMVVIPCGPANSVKTNLLKNRNKNRAFGKEAVISFSVAQLGRDAALDRRLARLDIKQKIRRQA